MFLANMELAERMEESADDMTAADTAPRPKKDTNGGQRCWSTMGRIMSAWSLSLGGMAPYVVWFQSEQGKDLMNTYNDTSNMLNIHVL